MVSLGRRFAKAMFNIEKRTARSVTHTQVSCLLDGANITPANGIVIFLNLPDLVAGPGMDLGDRSHPLAQKFLEYQRRSTKGYPCPSCTDVYHQEQTLWDHALKIHRESLGDLGSTEMVNTVRKRFRQEALDKAYVDFFTTSASRLPTYYYSHSGELADVGVCLNQAKQGGKA